MSPTRPRISSHGEELFLNCPRCGLSIKPRRSWLTIEHCPRCLARARIPVELFCSSLPTDELYGEGSAPGRTRRPTVRAGRSRR